ncbi:hypothetical protein V6N13_133806 [Hibiscus sabdariffa]
MTEVKSVTTLFVHNLLEKLHWKGLWAAFGHHGDVVDAFILKKMSKNGRWFRFVRFSAKADAIRAIIRLDGFILFGSRISVSYSRFKPRTTYWRKVNQSKPNKTQGIMEQHSAIPSKLTQNSVPASLPSKESYPRGNDHPKLTGFIAEEALWKLQYCLVGFTANKTDSNRVHERLCKWGLGGIKVKRMAGMIFLLKGSSTGHVIGNPSEVNSDCMGNENFSPDNNIGDLNRHLGVAEMQGLPSHIPMWAEIVGNCNSGRPQEQNLELGIGAGQLTSPPDPAQAENVDVAEEDMGPVKGVE